MGAIARPPSTLVSSLGLSSFYSKYFDVDGLPILASPRTSDCALREAAYIVRNILGPRQEILRAMAKNRVRLVVMAPSEMTTDVPEHADLTPKAYWDRRARGLGATAERPAVSTGEENLLDLRGDPYATENVLVHEFAHSIHTLGMSSIDPTFDTRLAAEYENAKRKGLWQGTYAMENRNEYWAEGAQSWFDCNRVDDSEHGPIDTREKLKAYDPGLARLLDEVFGDRPWRYTKPWRRLARERAHLAGFDPSTAGVFAWPATARIAVDATTPLPWLAPAEAPSATPSGTTAATSVLFVNRRAKEVSISWVDFAGKAKHYATIRPGRSHAQQTFVGHVWIVSEGERTLGAVVAAQAPGRVDVR
jgi:hypothetical protein